MKRLFGEYENQRCVCVLFPYRTDIWRSNALPAQKMIVELVNTMANYEPVLFGVVPHLVDFVKNNFSLHENVTVLAVNYNDSWARDSLSSVLCDGDRREVKAFGFNAYGTPLYTPYDDDQKLNQAIFANHFHYDVTDVPVTLEWGNITPDGNGTIFVIEDSIVNENRNPGKSKEEIERILLQATESKKVVWLPYGLDFDETGGHIDNVLAFADANTMLVSYTDDPHHAHYEKTQKLYEILSQCTNVAGEKYHIIKLPIPNTHVRSAKDSLNISENAESFARLEGDTVLYTYVNFVVINGAVVVPKFDIAQDEEAARILSEAFPQRKIIQLDAHEAFLGGGGFHCLTKHIN